MTVEHEDTSARSHALRARSALKVTVRCADPEGMSHHPARTVAITQRVRAERVSRRLARHSTGRTTRNFHRNERMKNGALLLLAAAATAGGVVSAFG